MSTLDKSSNPITVAGSSNAQPERQPEIFKLDIDCFDEILVHLSVKDLYSFGQTCKRMQKLAGEYYKQNHSYFGAYLGDNCVTIPGLHKAIGFYRFITKLKCGRNFECKGFRYLESHEFDSIKTLIIGEIDEEDISSLKKILPQIEKLEIDGCHMHITTYERMLKNCEKLKSLSIRNASPFFPQANVSVLHQRYPKLEHLEYPVASLKDITAFFEMNPQVQSFKTDIGFWVCEEIFAKSGIQLDKLEISAFFDFGNSTANDPQKLRDSFNQLYEKGFYKRLHLRLYKLNEKSSSNYLPSIRGFETLYVVNLIKADTLHLFTNLKGLSVTFSSGDTDMEPVAKNLANLQRLYFQHARFYEIMPFIRYSPKLTELQVIPSNKEHFIKQMPTLQTLNEEREKLMGARKMVIYAPENVVLKMKSTTKNANANLKLIEFRQKSFYSF